MSARGRRKKQKGSGIPLPFVAPRKRLYFARERLRLTPASDNNPVPRSSSEPGSGIGLPPPLLGVIVGEKYTTLVARSPQLKRAWASTAGMLPQAQQPFGPSSETGT